MTFIDILVLIGFIAFLLFFGLDSLNKGFVELRLIKKYSDMDREQLDYRREEIGNELVEYIKGERRKQKQKIIRVILVSMLIAFFGMIFSLSTEGGYLHPTRVFFISGAFFFLLFLFFYQVLFRGHGHRLKEEFFLIAKINLIKKRSEPNLHNLMDDESHGLS
jgi:hypothetical protein